MELRGGRSLEENVKRQSWRIYARNWSTNRSLGISKGCCEYPETQASLSRWSRRGRLTRSRSRTRADKPVPSTACLVEDGLSASNRWIRNCRTRYLGKLPLNFAGRIQDGFVIQECSFAPCTVPFRGLSVVNCSLWPFPLDLTFRF